MKNTEIVQKLNAESHKLDLRIREQRIDGLREIGKNCELLRRHSRKNRNHDLANRSWLLRSSADAWADFCEIFFAIKDGAYRMGWAQLEQIEIACYSIVSNLSDDDDTFEIRSLLSIIHLWQSLYPYKVFFSPEFALKREECSICSKPNTPWDDCGHSVGKLYFGKIAHRIIKDAEILGISVVTDPVQKYSVAIAQTKDGSDPSDYSLLAAVSKWLNSPYDGWKIRWTTKRHPHSLFGSARKEGPCPCESGRVYEACCLQHAGVLRPHCDVLYDNTPEGGLPSLQYLGRLYEPEQLTEEKVKET